MSRLRLQTRRANDEDAEDDDDDDDGGPASGAAHADGRVVQPAAWGTRSPARRDGLWSWVRVWRGSWAQRVPLRAREAAPASRWANAARRWAANGCVVARLVDRAAVGQLEQLQAAVVRVQAAVEQVPAKPGQVQEQQTDGRVVVQEPPIDGRVVVLEPQVNVHVLLVLAKPESVPATRSPATAALHNPHDPVAPAAVAQSADRSG